MADGSAGGSGGGESGGAGAGKAECVRLLLDAGADASLRDEGGRTALDLARRAKNTEVIEILSAHVD